MAKIETIEQLRGHYRPAMERAVAKQMPTLERHSRRYIELSPFVAVSSCGADGRLDVSPRGEKPGFVHVLDDETLAIPDRPGNNRLDTLQNLIANPEIGLMFVIPGVNEILRVNGTAEVRDDPELMQRFEVNGRLPLMVIVVKTQEVYLHCAKALARSQLWSAEARINRAALPTMSEMLSDQIGTDVPFESQEAMEQRQKAQHY
ncbi:MAG: pyridoxamine 5'-phosphate oxidase family protein [Hyphomicrobiaceae bacterium]